MVCCIDFSNIFFIVWSMFLKDAKEKNGSDYVIRSEDTGLFFHMLIRKIMDYITSYKDVVLCYEGEHSTTWRKKIFPPYKENRKKDDPNYKWVGSLMEKSKEFFKNFHTKILAVPYCEGDDCIYATCKYYSEKGEQVKIISNDKDLSQNMIFFEGVSQFNPIKKCNVEKNDNLLLEKAIVGDPSDNIKAFSGIGPKTFEKMINDQTVWNKKMTPEKLEILDNIMKIIDLRKYPEEYQNAIKEELDKPWNEFNPTEVEKFLLDNSLKSVYNDWTNKYCNDIQALNFEQEDAIDEIMDIINS